MPSDIHWSIGPRDTGERMDDELLRLVIFVQCQLDAVGQDSRERPRLWDCMEVHLRAARDALREALDLLGDDDAE